LKKEELESGTKQPNTELTDRLDRWQQHLDDLDKQRNWTSYSKMHKPKPEYVLVIAKMIYYLIVVLKKSPNY
jgi:hypothetical protein